MATDAGTRAMEARRRRQWMALAVLMVVAVGIGAARLAQLVPARASADADDTAARPEQMDATEDRAAPELAPTEATWPVELERDLFAWDRVFPPPADAPAEEAPTVVAEAPAIDPAELQREAQRVVRVQAIVLGDDPIAMINGEVWRPGQVVEGFRIVRLRDRRIVLEKEGVEVILEL